MSYRLFNDASEAERYRSEADKAAGNPRKGVNVGQGPHAKIPDTYFPGAIGWTATECATEKDETGLTLVFLSDRAKRLDTSGMIITEKPASFVKPTKGIIDGAAIDTEKP